MKPNTKQKNTPPKVEPTKVEPVKPPPAVEAKPQGPFFRRVDWSAFWTAFALSLAVYVYTLAPNVTLEDSGELCTGSATLGVPHPPGYPIWSIITWVFTRVFAFVRFRGQPDPAWSVALSSAFWGALASGFAAILICRSGTDMLRSLKRTTEVIGRRTEDVICWVAGVSSSLVFAFTPVNWSQSVIVEAYSLNAFFLVLILFLMYVWMRAPREPLPYVTGLVASLGFVSLVVMIGLTIRQVQVFPEDFWNLGIHYVLSMLLYLALIPGLIYVWRKHPEHRLLYLMSFAFGLGLTNYQVLLLLIASLALVILLKDLTLFRDFVIVGIPYVAVYLLITNGKLPFEHPTDAATYVYFLLNAGLLAIVYFYLPNGKAVAPAVVCVLLGLAVYEYMPLSSETNPPINWGYPRTWEGFVHAITRGQYERISPSNIFSKAFLLQVGDYLRDLRGTFTLPIAILGFLPFAAWNVAWKGRRMRMLYPAAIMAALAIVLVLTEEILVPTLSEIPAFSLAYRALSAGIMLLAACGVVIMMYLEAKDLLVRMFSRRAPGAEPAGPAPLVDMDVDALCRKWMLVIMSGFLVMSFVLVLLASPKSDIQDEFIQRVKFISSHALFSFWIGYGILLSLAFVDTILKGNRLVVWGGIGAALVMTLIPLYENGYNKEMIRINGGAEQNGHDFGWQFGNYELRGAAAISEELAPEEEPLPNPAFPPAMGPDAVFFGGTDPGRFVPTYMIYCADVRPDVYLITQNALADNTYMQVMRDLYGDTIYIPSQEDSARAFQRYVEEVRAGKRAPNAELKIENGRVQVSGALGVMEINGILAQMIFERNNYDHDFFVEESYVIQWMYPYLEPHGLIMKIDAKPVTLTDEMVRNDSDFWDWYTRRLHDDRKFIRDVCARKSFSKLRSAIAGLYAHQGRSAEAENAFQQARILYPLSPEANFRMVQEVFMSQNRFGDAKEVMQVFGKMDPGNDKVPEFVNHLDRLEQLSKRTDELEAMRRKGQPMDVTTAFELAACYAQLQRLSEFTNIMASLMSNTNLPAPYYYRAATMMHEMKEFGDVMSKALDQCAALMPQDSPPEILLNMARMYLECQRNDKAMALLSSYVKKQPTDWKACLDLGYLCIEQGKAADAVQALTQAKTYGGDEALGIISQDQRFAPVRDKVLGGARNLMNLPGGAVPGLDPMSGQP